jgi:hypothetical protein
MIYGELEHVHIRLWNGLKCWKDLHYLFCTYLKPAAVLMQIHEYFVQMQGIL